MGILKKSPNFVPRIKLTQFHPKLFKTNQTQFFRKFDNRKEILCILEVKIKFRLSSDPSFLTFSTLNNLQSLLWLF